MRMLWRSLALCGLALTLAPCAQAAEPIEGKTVYIDAGHAVKTVERSETGSLKRILICLSQSM
nr:YqiI [Bacillus subtilis]